MLAPFRLRRRGEAAPAAGLLLFTDDAAELLTLHGRLGVPSPELFAVAGGFLLVLRRPAAGVVPGAVRLRRLRDRLFLPVDADLEPALFDDEAAALVRERGLVFLPGGVVLGYCPDQPLSLSALLAPPPQRREAWRPLPEAPALADRLREAALELPEPPAEEALEAGGEGIGVEAPRPPGAGPLNWLLAQLGAAAGRGLNGLGSVFRQAWLARLGAGMIAAAVRRAPRLSESVLGRQEAALRELLRRFREGDLESALRRALPLGEPGGRGGAPAPNAVLPTHNLNYSVRGLLGGGRGPASIWYGGGDVQALLAQEYRKAAAAAAARGDHRRAAFIYGKLLKDYGLAAAVLAQGGLHHDAARIYLEKLKDLRSAARSFAAAGEIDRAVSLYRDCHEHAAAGDLLRQAGEEEAALAEYRAGADWLVRRHFNHLAAGELLLTRARRRDLALVYFRAGWAQRPGGGAFACLLRLAELFADDASPRALLALAGEADLSFRRGVADRFAGSFYNELARLADRPHLAAERARLRDLARLGLAAVLSRHTGAAPGPTPATLFGLDGPWRPEVAADAEAAVKAARSRGGRARAVVGSVVPVELGVRGEVAASCGAAESGEVLIGFRSGAFAAYKPTCGAAATASFGRLASLAAVPSGDLLAVVFEEQNGSRTLVSYIRDPAIRYQPLHQRTLPGPANYRLTPLRESDGEAVGGLLVIGCLTLLRGSHLLPVGEIPLLPSLVLDFFGVEPLPLPGTASGAGVLLVTPDQMICVDEKGNTLGKADLDIHSVPAGRGQYVVVVESQDDRGVIELALIEGRGGALRWHRWEYAFAEGSVSFRRVGHKRAAAADWQAVCLARPGWIAAVAEGGVQWLRTDGDGPTLTGAWAAEFRFPGPIACYPSPSTGEVTVLCRGGELFRATTPGG
jgi:hypothetical protein